MLKALVLALLLANGVLLAANLGVWPTPGQQPQREPDRLQRQIRPEMAHTTPGSGRGAWPADPARAARGAASAGATGAVAADPAGAPASAASDPAATGPDPAASPAVAASGLNGGVASAPGTANAAGAGQAAGASAAANGAVACLLVAPLTADQASNLAQTLAAAGLAASSWRRQALPAAPQYWIVMGRYADRGQLVRKQAELRRRQVAWTLLQPGPNVPPGVAPGLKLGQYGSDAEARAALDRLEDRDVRSARVVALPAIAGQQQLQLPALDAAQLARVLRVATPVNTRWLNCDGSQPEAPARAAPTRAGQR